MNRIHRSVLRTTVALLIVSVLIPMTGSSGLWAQEPDPEDWRDQMIEDFLTLSREVAHSGDQDKPVEFQGDPPDVTSGLSVVRDSPLLEEECRRDAISFAVQTMEEVKNLGTDDAIVMARQHLAERQALIRDGEVDYTSYLRHIGECRGFCGPLVAELLRCHEVAVARHERGVVYFDLNEAVVRTEQVGSVAEIVRRLKEDPRQKVLLIGRASRIGALAYNRVLSGRRAFAVRDELVDRGIAEDRIENLWLGYEPPQISRETAELYGIDSVYRQLGAEGTNQSVMMVLYQRAEESEVP